MCRLGLSMMLPRSGDLLTAQEQILQAGTRPRGRVGVKSYQHSQGRLQGAVMMDVVSERPPPCASGLGSFSLSFENKQPCCCWETVGKEVSEQAPDGRRVSRLSSPTSLVSRPPFGVWSDVDPGTPNFDQTRLCFPFLGRTAAHPTGSCRRRSGGG